MQGLRLVIYCVFALQIIDEADRMIDSMHHNWLNQVVKAVYKVDGHSAADALFQRVEPGVCTAVR